MRSLLLCFFFVLVGCGTATSFEIKWVHLSSRNGDLPDPGGSNQQTALLAADFDKSGATAFIVGCRVTAPALVLYRRSGKSWTRSIIEKDYLPIEAGGAAADIDGDGDLDAVFGGDYQSNHLWWWENPYPRFDPETPWKRHLIKNSGANQHHDQIFADVKGSGKSQLLFWNQRAKAILLAGIPADPRSAAVWPLEVLYSGGAGDNVENAAKYAEGIDAADVDGDGRVDLLAGNSWFYRDEAGRYVPVQIGTIGGRIKAGRFQRGKLPQVVIAPGDGSGPLRFYWSSGNPRSAESWSGRTLLERDMVHGHTLDVGDIDGDGHLDIFAAEMAQWTRNPQSDHPEAKAWILYGDSKGNFRNTVLVTGHGWHEGKLADVDGDGDLDIVNKPYTWNTPRIDVWLNNGTGRQK
ncbi:MAG: VCBS repeat-containing protein [Bryobacteraceae bacterium]|nr:VCBS repeat-containing protein [Bryobacteraceae bacterium]